MKIGVMDYHLLGDDVDVSVFSDFGELEVYKNLSRAEILEKAEDKDIVVINKVLVDKEFLDRAKRLKMVAVAATGYNVVDVEYAREKGIKVYNVSGYSREAVVQHTFAMVLSMLCHLSELNRYIKAGEYSSSTSMTRLDLHIGLVKNMKWGVIGLGDIGRGVAKIADAFGAEVIYTSDKEEDAPYRRLELDELLAESDIVSIHCPLTEETMGMIGKSEFEKMKKSAIIVNVARGGIIDEDTLTEALKSGEIRGACLDVFSQEPLPADSSLIPLGDDKILMTPHTAWASTDARNLLVQGVYNNIKSFIENGDIKPL